MPETEPAVGLSASPLRLLVLADSTEAGERFAAVLERAGYAVSWNLVRSGDVSLEKLGNSDFDLIVADLDLRSGPGAQTLEILKESGKPTPVIAVTAPVGGEAIERVECGAADCVSIRGLELLPEAVNRFVGERARGGKASRSLRFPALDDVHEEAHYRLLFERNPQPMWVYDLETLKFLAVNDAAVRQYGYSGEEFLNMTIKDIRPAEEIPKLLTNLSSATDPALTSAGWKHCKKDGSVIDVEIASHSLNFADRSARLVLATDVTQQRRAREALQHSEASYRSLVEGAPYGIFRATPEGVLLSANPLLAEMLGFAAEADLIGVNLARQAHLDPEDWRRLVGETQTAARLRGVEVRWKRRDGTLIDVRLSGRAVYDEAKRLVGSEFVAEDITQRKRLEQQFLQAQRMEAVGRLAGGVAHDFNNLLSVILGYAELVLDQLPPGSEISPRLEQITQAARRAAGLTRQLLAFSRQQVLQPRVLNLNTIIREMESLLERLIGEDIRVVSRLDEHLASVRADPGQVEQVIMNLAINARDAMPRGGTLTLQTRNVQLDEEYCSRHSAVPPGDYILLEMSDDGCGMDAETQARIFEPFFTTKETGKGTGLGLATVYGIVKQSGGHIWLYSEPGLGSTFKIYLPALEVPADIVRQKPKEASPDGTETVLVVEDADSLRELTCEVLEARGYRVLEAGNAEEAVKQVLAYSERIHLVVTDVIMPGIGGPDLVRKLEALRPGVKALYISGYTEDAFLNLRLLDVRHAFLQKPFMAGELARKVREVLDAGTV